MQIPLQISFRNMDPPLGTEDRIREKAAALEHFFSRIMSCRIVVERRHHRHHKGNLFNIRIDLGVPGAELVVNRIPPEHHAHEDLLAAIRDAFDEARRRLEDHAREVRADTKTHLVPQHGRVTRLMSDEGYGFIESLEGQEIYFQRESMPDGDFGKLSVGSEVRFFVHSGEGEKGEQASTVTRIGKHHLPPTDTM